MNFATRDALLGVCSAPSFAGFHDYLGSDYRA